MRLSNQIYAARRAALVERTGAATVVIASAPVAVRNGDVEHEYRQSSDFYYLTGFDEPESVCVLSPGHAEHDFVLFVRPRDRAKETWTGRRAGVEGAVENFGADAAYPISELDKWLPAYLGSTSRLVYSLGRQRDFDAQIFKALASVRARWREGLEAPNAIEELTNNLHEQRLFKREEEISAMAEAADITAQAHRSAMQAARPGMFEFQVDSVIGEVFKRRGALRAAYPSIVASGDNATILHYVRNDRQMEAGDLLLIDAGAEYGYYAADVTRTFPVSGTFSAPQRAVYEVVLAAQLAAIDACRVGTSFDGVHQVSLRTLCEGLIDLGLVKGDVDEVIEEGDYKRYFMHRTGHWLGMDVHDVGRYLNAGESRPLEPGMYLTVEPGLYIASDDEQAAEEFRGIGVRIEDDILVTETGPRNMTAAVPKAVDEVEALCRS